MIGARLRAIIVKELWAILRDPKARITLVVPPLLQLFLFGFASTLEVSSIRVGVLNMDNGAYSREVIQRIAGSPNVARIVALRSDAELRQAIDRQQVIAAVRFDATFSADIAAGRGATLGAIYDGRRSNAAQIVSGYIERIAGEVGASVSARAPPVVGQSIVTHWFNPNLTYLWFVMPALIVIIAAVSALSVVSQSVARERELGTFDQLMVSPLRTYEILIGKMVPPVVIGLANVTLFVLLIPTVFGVPLTGSLLLFYIALLFYLLALTGIGMLISTLSQTQQQAFLGMFLATVPLIILSGYASPVDNMPDWLRIIAYANPPTWFLNISEGVFLKAMPASAILANTWPLVIIAGVSIAAASMLFRSRME
ncbi:ABC transporter permease [Sphingomonas sp. G-3-2-10]|uniref:ABC transporter permease n=1 Tax=Sphingomonas sp. G-3-2-10 TaxID=2728838 RepID=UPI00146A4DA4|nr:ABC transporter permease [Sphingomonas sp. G-3-2-10]NML07869.1 ABC transporter permease [Sphingomonas sp. G-3-2-10]